MKGTMEENVTLDALILAVAYKQPLRVRLFKKMDVSSLATGAARLLVQLASVGGAGWQAELVYPPVTRQAREELVKFGWLRCEERVREGNGTHPVGLWLELTARGRRHGKFAVSVLEGIREKVASDQCAVISGKAEEFQNH